MCTWSVVGVHTYAGLCVIVRFLDYHCQTCTFSNKTFKIKHVFLIFFFHVINIKSFIIYINNK